MGNNYLPRSIGAEVIWAVEGRHLPSVHRQPLWPLGGTLSGHSLRCLSSNRHDGPGDNGGILLPRHRLPVLSRSESIPCRHDETGHREFPVFPPCVHLPKSHGLIHFIHSKDIIFEHECQASAHSKKSLIPPPAASGAFTGAAVDNLITITKTQSKV